MEVFTEEWSQACCDELNRREVYRGAAAEWEAPVVLVMERDPALGVEEDRAFLLDLHRGECRGTRRATEDDMAQVSYVMRATPAAWRHILDGELDPITAVMTGRLRLARGSLLSLARYTAAAREMVAAAGAVEATFPPPRL
ncbi:MAG TPA: SCP2 sterol-binding domain-containing protein [Longimicrobiaceae bacterium]|nr:SCP2 sterol-binding domain-containing protein [Longimicrobiaceae bacterium]